MASSSTSTLNSVLEIFQQCLSRGEWCRVYAEVLNGQEFVSFSVQKPMENSIVAGTEKYKSQGQKRRERRKRMKEKMKTRQNEEKETANDQEVTTQEVSTDTEATEEVFDEDLVSDGIIPRTRLRVRSRRVVLSVGEAVARPFKPNVQIEQVDGIFEADKDESNDAEKDTDKMIEEDEEEENEFDLLRIFLESEDLGWKESKVLSSTAYDALKTNVESNLTNNEISVDRFTRFRREDSENTFGVFVKLVKVIKRENVEKALRNWKGFKIHGWEGSNISKYI